jgi:hypothetical protein
LTAKIGDLATFTPTDLIEQKVPSLGPIHIRQSLTALIKDTSNREIAN